MTIPRFETKKELEDFEARVDGDTLREGSLTAASDPDDLARIYIRARVHDKWGSFSLRELLENGHPGQIGYWFQERILGLIGLEDGAVVTEASVHLMLDLLEHNLGIPIVRLKIPERRLIEPHDR